MKDLDQALLERIKNNDSSLSRLDLSTKGEYQDYLMQDGYHQKDDTVNDKIIALAEVLTDNNTIEHVDISGNPGMNLIAVKAFSEMLKKNNTITSLCFDHNELNGEKLSVLIDAFIQNKTLTSISLANNGISTNSDTNLLEKLLIENNTLTSLNLRGRKGALDSRINHYSLQPLIAGLVKNYTLKSLNLSHQEFNGKAFEMLAELLNANRGLTELNISHAIFYAEREKEGARDQGLITFFNAISNNHSLLALNISGIFLLSKVAHALLAALAQNDTLVCLGYLRTQFESIGGGMRQDWELIGKFIACLKRKQEQAKERQNNFYQRGLTALQDGEYDKAIEQFMLGLEIADLLQEGWEVTELHKLLQDALKEAQEKHTQQKQATDQNRIILINQSCSQTALKSILQSSNNALEKPIDSSPISLVNQLGQLNISLHIPYNDLTFGKELGKGSFGVVYEGKYNYAPVAIKQLLSQQLNEELLEEFKREVSLMANLRSPYLVQLMGACFESPHYCLVMEYMAKGSLYDLLQSKESLSWGVRYPMALQISYGLAYLHKHHIVHGDLKSLNVLVNEHYQVEIADFGMAKVKISSSASTVFGPSSGGSIRWMAPELFEEEAKNTKASDVYSYGMILWELGSRQIPFFKKAPRNEAVPFLLVKGTREDIAQEVKDQLPSMAHLITRCWAGQSEQRPSVEEAIQVLEQEHKAVFKK